MTHSHCDVWITSEDFNFLMGHLFPGDGDEHGAVLQAGVVEGDRGLRLVVRRVTAAQYGTDYVPGEHGYRALSPTFIHQQIISCRDNRLAYLAVHNHDCDDSVGFSRIDMASHERGYPALRDIGKGVPVGALVFGRNSAQMDLWMPDGSRRTLRELRIIGPTVHRLYPKPRRSGRSNEAYDRQVRMFGAVGQELLGECRAAVIGLGGIGSLVAEYLARLGVGDMILVDPDVIETTNLSRVVGATYRDVEDSRRKVQIARDHLAEASQGQVRCLADDVARRSVAAKLTQCDFIFLAADSMRARLVANALSHQYLIPVVQLGAKVRPTESGALLEAMSVVRQVRPGHGCLWCNGLIDSTQLATEAKSDDERKRQAYGVEEPNPSVITLNAVAASHGVNGFLFDFLNLRSKEESEAYRHFHFLRDRHVHVKPRKDLDCRECCHRLGMGDGMHLPCVDD